MPSSSHPYPLNRYKTSHLQIRLKSEITFVGFDISHTIKLKLLTLRSSPTLSRPASYRCLLSFVGLAFFNESSTHLFRWGVKPLNKTNEVIHG
jgi:hypothetical protein